MNRISSFLTFSLFVVVVLTGCDSNSTDVDSELVVTARASDIPADPITGVDDTGRPVGANSYTFFSLRTGEIVPQADSASTGWDLAFKGTTILINGGSSGPGEGAALLFEGLFSDVSSAPDEGWQQDSTDGPAIPAGSGLGWYSYNPVNHVISPIPGRVLLIRTADGRFAKVSMASYYRGAPAEPGSDAEGRYLTFDYVFQPDGSRSFE